MRFKRLFNKGVFFKAVSGTVHHAGQRCLTDSDKSSTTVTSPRRPLLSETGRSMIEMLGVLVIIGVLSIAAVTGYRFALLKFRASEVTNELNMRAISASAQILNAAHEYTPNAPVQDGFGESLAVGFPVETSVSDRNPDYFEILVGDVPTDLCRQILRDYENPIMIFVNDVRYNTNTGICNETALNDMGFIYKNDLGTHEACSDRGYFGEEDFLCHCSGNTYLDVYTNDCLCPAGHVWSAGEGTCIESICPEGQFESKTAGCVPCSDEKTYTIATDERHKALCTASTCGRIVVGSNCVNAVVNNCSNDERHKKLKCCFQKLEKRSQNAFLSVFFHVYQKFLHFHFHLCIQLLREAVHPDGTMRLHPSARRNCALFETLYSKIKAVSI